jgi:predicted ATPase with chaperone activity
LSAEHLELGYDSVARFYQAPKHLKAQGGVLVVDDFGRQRVSPTDLLNRWIMALERGRDNLLLRTGESIEVPFSMTLLFSTNLNPQDLADAAFLRRIPYKVYIPTATREQFGEILRQAADEHGITYSADGLAEVSAYVEEACGQRLSGSLARDLAALVVDNAHHDGREPALETEAVSLAFDQFTGQANNAGSNEPSDS